MLTRNLVISRNEPIALKRQLSRNILGKLNPAAINLSIYGQRLYNIALYRFKPALQYKKELLGFRNFLSKENSNSSTGLM